MPSAVLIPIKSFDLAKGRLSEAIAPEQRAALAQHMAGTVIAAAQDLTVWVVCGDHAVADFARERGAQVIWRAPRGLNGAIVDGTEHLAARGFDRAIIAHADLPLAKDLRMLDIAGDTDAERTLIENTVYLVPDRRNDGSNVMSIPLGRGFTFHYGAGSAAAHQAEANALACDSNRSLTNNSAGMSMSLKTSSFSTLHCFIPTRPTLHPQNRPRHDGCSKSTHPRTTRDHGGQPRSPNTGTSARHRGAP